MVKNSIINIIEKWGQQQLRKSFKVSTAGATKKDCNAPNSIKSQLAINPYASILASPLRRCAFYGRIFPSKLLLRFSRAWYPRAESVWAYPSLSKTEGRGYYVRLQKKLTDFIQKGGHRAIFKGPVVYRSDMNKHVENLLFRQSWMEFSKYATDEYDLLSPTNDKSVWAPHSQAQSKGYQCILIFDPLNGEMIADLNHTIENQKNIPCYNVHMFWAKDDINHIKSKYNITPLALGVPKRHETKQLAELLWRSRQFII